MVRVVSFVAFWLALVFPAPAAAQQLLGEYFTFIDYGDMQNSQGIRLRDFCAMVQQDRANFHRFGRAHELDDWDPWFGAREARDVIGRTCQVGPGAEYIPGYALGGNEIYIRVLVYGRGGRPTFVQILEGAG